jgi:hypothetical protein
MQALKDAAITMDRIKAREKVAEYLKSVRTRHNAEDEAILRGYKALAKGHTVIDLPKCIRLGGTFDNGLPRLAAATASHEWVWVHRDSRGAVSFRPTGERGFNHRRRKDVYRCPDNTLPPLERGEVPYIQPSRWQHPWDGVMMAMVPPVPPGLRPTFSLDGYTTLFEVDQWSFDPKAPVDPALLKHIGGDLYAVVATWDLTELERTVLDGHRSGR